MARKLKTFKPPRRTGRKPTYPWEKWLDGSTWELLHGRDFQSTIGSMQKFIREVASKRGVAISVFRSGIDRLVIRPISSVSRAG